MGQSHSQPLTFGVEIEFALATTPLSGVNPAPNDPRTLPPSGCDARTYYELVASTLRTAGVEAEARAQSMFSSDGRPRNSKGWGVLGDTSIMCTDKMYEWEKIELNSPVLRYSKEALEEIRVVCETLARTYRIDCNRSCGIHVHVGNGYNGFEFETVRTLMAILWTFEHQIEMIHPYHRRENERYCPSFRRSTVLAKSVDWSPQRGLDLLTAVKDFPELRELTDISASNYRRMSYYLGDPCARLDINAGIKRTIEFRQHKSTLEVEAIHNWVTLCVKIVEFAVVKKEKAVHSWLQECITKDKDSYPLEKILHHLNLKTLVPFFAKVVEDNYTDEDLKLKGTQDLFYIGKSFLQGR